MEASKLKTIIDQKNERRERETLHTAEQIIDGIASEQQKIKASQSRIAEYREELKGLEVQTLDASELLGE